MNAGDLPRLFMRIPLSAGLNARVTDAIGAHRVALQEGAARLSERLDALAWVFAFYLVGLSRADTPDAVIRRIAHDKLGRALTYALKHRPPPADRMRSIN